MRIIIIFSLCALPALAGELSLLSLSSRLASPVGYHATGSAGIGPFRKKRDRTYRIVPRGGQVDVEVDDHVTKKVARGTFAVDGEGAAVGASGELLSATNLLGITPKILGEVSGGRTVAVPGAIAVNGSVASVTFTHRRGASPREVITQVSGSDGIALTTVTQMADDGLPAGARTTGKVGAATVDLSLERLR